LRHNAVVANLQYVWFWPNGGHRDGMWDPRGSSAVDRFARTSRRVTERYSEGLQEHEIAATRTAIQMIAVETQQPTDEVVVHVALRQFDGDEAVRVDLPRRVADLPGPVCSLLVLDVVSAAMARLAQLRGWRLSPFDQARQHVIDHQFSFEIAGPWKSNRARTLRARPVLRVGGDGFGEKAFEIADAGSGATLGFTRGEMTPVNSQPKFKRDIRKWRWADTSVIECPDGWQIRLDTDWGKLARFDASDLHAWPLVNEPMPHNSPLSIRVQDM